MEFGEIVTRFINFSEVLTDISRKSLRGPKIDHIWKQTRCIWLICSNLRGVL